MLPWGLRPLKYAMATLILIILALFLSLVNILDLGWVLVQLVDLPALYYHLFIWCVLAFRAGIFLWSRRWLFRSLLRRFYLWLDDEDHSGPGSSKGPGGGKALGTRRFSSSAVIREGDRGGHNFPQKIQSPLTPSNGEAKLSIFSHFGRLPMILGSNFNAMLGVKARPLLRKVLLGVSAVCGVRVSQTKFACLTLIVSRIAFLRKTMGLKGVTLYLKAVFVLLQQSLAGDKSNRDTALISKMRVSVNRQGLPRIIPKLLRDAIRRGDFAIIRLVSSIASLYRNTGYEGTPKLNTITDPFNGKGALVPELNILAPVFIRLFVPSHLDPMEYIRVGINPLILLLKAAPGMIKEAVFGMSNYSTHPHNVLRSLQSLYNQPQLWFPLMTVLKWTDNRYMSNLISIAVSYGLLLPGYKGALGKLHAKEEAAGKVRLFAMVDCWTQWALYPIHQFIFRCLRDIGQDGTFDQTKPLEALKDKPFKASYDLTAATDRLPLFIQKTLISCLFNDEFAQAWAQLLVGRVYEFYQLGYSLYHGIYKYITGQPMGAYSSWASLAMTHHFLVQCAAWKSGVVPIGTWFKDYAILGDDIVICNKRVAECYLEILEDLGMPINLSKSVVSPTGSLMEFAKRTIYRGIDVSPIPTKEMASAQGLVPALVQFGIKYQLTLPRLLQAFGFGWRDISWLNKPLNKLPAQIRTIVLASSMPKSAEELIGFFNIGTKRLTTLVNDLVQVGIDFKHTTLAACVPKVRAKMAAVQQVKGNKVELIEQMSVSWREFIAAKMAVRYIPGLREDSVLSAPFLPSIQAWVADAFLPKDYDIGVRLFYHELWKGLYGPAIDSYEETIRDSVFNVEAMAGMHRGNSMLVLPSFHTKHANAMSYGFYHRYWDFIQTLEDLALASPAVLAFARPEGIEGYSLNYNAVTPLHLRYYRLWSGILQNNIPTMGIGMKIPRPPLGVVPSQITESQPATSAADSDDDDEEW
jgi:hypothetical protein